MQRIALLLLCLFLAVGWVVAEEDPPTLYYYAARGQNLIAVHAGGENQPAFLVFPGHGRFLSDFALQLGNALFPGDANERAQKIRQFQSALKKEYSSAVAVSGVFGVNTVQQIHRSADRITKPAVAGGVLLVNVNKVLQSKEHIDTLRSFLRITTQATQTGNLTADQIDRCRPTIERNLNSFVERSAVRIVRGSLRGIFGLAACSEDRTDTDGDGLYDIDEVNLYGSDPLKPDTDGDGLTDKEEVTARSRGIMISLVQKDSDGDGLDDYTEMKMREAGVMVDPGRADTDADGLTDKQEAEATYRGRRFDPTNPTSFPGGMTDQEIYAKHVLPSGKGSVGKVILIIFLVVLAIGAGLALYFFGREPLLTVYRDWRKPKAPTKLIKVELPEKDDIADLYDSGTTSASETEIEIEEDEKAQPEMAGGLQTGQVQPDAPQEHLGGILRRIVELDEMVKKNAQLTVARQQALNDQQAELISRLDGMGAMLGTLKQAAASPKDALEIDVEGLRSRFEKMDTVLKEWENKMTRIDALPPRDPEQSAAGLGAVTETLEQVKSQIDQFERQLAEVADFRSRCERVEMGLEEVKGDVRTTPAYSTGEVDEVEASQMKSAMDGLQEKMEYVDGDLAAFREKIDQRIEIIETAVESLDTHRIELLEEKVQAVKNELAKQTQLDAAGLEDRIQATGRVIQQINEKLEFIPAVDEVKTFAARLEKLEQAPASKPPEATESAYPAESQIDLTEVTQKLKKTEQMIIRSMSEWGRLFTDLEEKVDRSLQELKRKP